MRAVAFVVIVLALQSALGVLLPQGFAQPDLFLLAALTVSTRLRPPVGLAVAFAIGLLRDLLQPGGLIGFHGAGVAAGVFASFFVRRYLSAETSLNHATAVLVAEVAKWLVFLLLSYWARTALFTEVTLLGVFVPELITTLLFGPFVYWLATWGFGPPPQSDERLL